MSTILLVGVDVFFRGKLDVLRRAPQADERDSVDPPDLVICDLARVDADEVAETYPDVPILGFTNHTDTAGLRAAQGGRPRPGRRALSPSLNGRRSSSTSWLHRLAA